MIFGLLIIFLSCEWIGTSLRHPFNKGWVWNKPLTFSTCRWTQIDSDHSQRPDLVEFNKRLLECARAGDSVKADSIWREMLQCDQQPDKASLELLLLTSLNSKELGQSRHVLDECESILNEIIKTYHLPSEKIIVAVMKAFGRLNLLDRVERLYDRISFISGDQAIGIGVYNAIISAWARSDSVDAPKRANEWLERLEFAGLTPNQDTFDALLCAWTLMGKDASGDTAARQASKILGRMASPTLAHYEAAITAWSQSQALDALEQIESITGEIVDRGLVLSQKCYNGLLAVYNSGATNVDRETIPETISKIIAQMESQGLDILPALATLAVALTRCEQAGAAGRAAAALHKIEALGGLPPPWLYSAVIEALGRAGLPMKAESVLDRYISSYIQQGQGGRTTSADQASSIPAPLTATPLNLSSGSIQIFAPRKTSSVLTWQDTRPWNSVIGAFGRTGAVPRRYAKHISSPVLKADAQDAQRVLEKMLSYNVAPDIFTFSSLISIWASAGNITMMQSTMADMGSRGIAPPSMSYLALIRELMKTYTSNSSVNMPSTEAGSSQPHMPQSIQESFTTIQGVFTAMCRAPTREMAYCTEAYHLLIESGFTPSLNLFKEVLRLFAPGNAASNEQQLARRSDEYASSPSRGLAAALSLTESPADSAMDVINRMIKASIEPDQECYLLLLQAFEASAATASTIPDLALRVVKSMLQAKLTPSEEIYEILLRIWAKSQRPDAPRVTESVFRSMLGRLPTAPSQEAFLRFLETWVYSKLPNAAEKAEEIYETMKAAQVERTPQMFYLLARAWAMTSRRSGPFAVVSVNSTIQRDNFKMRTEGVYSRCLQEGLQPNQKMVRLMIAVWAQDRSASSLDKADTLLAEVSLQQPIDSSPPLSPRSSSLMNPLFYPRSFIDLIDAWTEDPIRRAQNLTARIIGMGGAGEQLRIACNVQLAAYSRLAEQHSHLAEELYGQMLSPTPPSAPSVTARVPAITLPAADTVSLNLVLRCLLRSHRRDALERCQSIITSSAAMNVFPDEYTFSLMVGAWRERRSQDVAAKAQGIFDAIALTKIPSRETFALLLEVQDGVDPRKASSIVDAMLKAGHIPAPRTFQALMGAWEAKHRAEMCEALFEKMLSFNIRPDGVTSRHLLSALASSQRVDSAERTEGTLKRLLALGTSMDLYMTVSVLKAWQGSSSPTAPGRAEKTLQLAASVGVRLTVVEYNMALDILGKSKRPQAAQRVAALLDRMKECGIEPDIVSYNCLVLAWGKSAIPEAEARAMETMREARDAGCVPDLITYSSLLSTMSRSSDPQSPIRASQVFDEMVAIGLVPDKVCWTILMNLWAKSNLAEREERVESLFQGMLSRGLTPNAVTYTVILKMWASSAAVGAGRKVAETFRHMIANGVKLDTVGYSALLSSLGQSEDIEAPHKASEVFQQMIASGAVADVKSWTIIMSIWAKSSLSRALKEKRIEEYYSRMLEYGCTPNAFTYTVLLVFWRQGCSTNNPRAHANIKEIYDRCVGDHVPLDGRAFVHLLNALISAFEKVVAFDKAEMLLVRMSEYGMVPDAQSWCAVISADTTNKALERAKRLYRAWRQCLSSSSSQSVNQVIRKNKPFAAAFAGKQSSAASKGGARQISSEAAGQVFATIFGVMARHGGDRETVIERWKQTLILLKDLQTLKVPLTPEMAGHILTAWGNSLALLPQFDTEWTTMTAFEVIREASAYSTVGGSAGDERLHKAWSVLLSAAAETGWARSVDYVNEYSTYLEQRLRQLNEPHNQDTTRRFIATDSSHGPLGQRESVAVMARDGLSSALTLCREGYWSGGADKSTLSSILTRLLPLSRELGATIDKDKHWPILSEVLGGDDGANARLSVDLGALLPANGTSAPQRWRKKV